MSADVDNWVRGPLLSDRPAAQTRRARLMLLLAWIAVTAWLAANHVPWRDEVRAWSMVQSATSWPDLFRVVHGEGHPYLWYILLRAGDGIAGVREVLPALGLAIGVATAAILALRAPFRIGLIAILLFSQHLGFDYSVVSRNYGLTALLLVVLAATYRRVRDSLWFGLLLLLLCNTNAPSVFLAGAMFLYRMIELAMEKAALRSAEVRRLALNGVLLLLGVLLCFLAIYPPANDAAAAAGRIPFTAANLFYALIDAERSFAALGFDNVPLATNIFLVLSLLVFARSKPAILAVLAGFLTLKLFFFFAFPAGYRHAALFLWLLVAILWIEGDKRSAFPAKSPSGGSLALLAGWGFLSLLAMQTILYLRKPVAATAASRPWSHAADLASLAQRPENRGAIMMFDPDALGESVVYHTGQPFWLLRQGRMGTFASFSTGGKRHLRLNDFLNDAAMLHARSGGRPVLIVLKRDLRTLTPGRYDVMYGATTDYGAGDIGRFRATTRQVASFNRAFGDETYDVYRYPR